MTAGTARPSVASTSGLPGAPVRLGVIDYLNVQPVYAWMLRRAEAPGVQSTIETVTGVPTEMNTALANGTLDISNVSSYAYGHHSREWVLLPHLAVAARGRVDSVLLFSWHREWQALDGEAVALTNHSATGSALVRALCEQRYHVRPRFEVTEPDLDSMLATHAAALLIGDRALIERDAGRAVAGRGQPYVFDLAAEWTAWTRLPFVFAVWAGRADRVEALRDSGILQVLRQSTDWGLAHLDEIAAEYASRLALSQETCAAYLRLLDYDLGEDAVAGLRTFLELSVPGFAWETVRVLEP